jgi:hypothetical protein
VLKVENEVKQYVARVEIKVESDGDRDGRQTGMWGKGRH